VHSKLGIALRNYMPPTAAVVEVIVYSRNTVALKMQHTAIGSFLQVGTMTRTLENSVCNRARQ